MQECSKSYVFGQVKRRYVVDEDAGLLGPVFRGVVMVFRVLGLVVVRNLYSDCRSHIAKASLASSPTTSMNSNGVLLIT